MDRTTEQVRAGSVGLDTLPVTQVVRSLVQAQHAAAGAVAAAPEDIAAGAAVMAQTIRGGGILCYIGAGSSGLMAAADAMELAGTFGIAPDQVRILMAGGLPTSAEMPGSTEDAVEAAAEDLAALRKTDTAIAVSASGSTPYTLAATKAARARGAAVLGIANTPHSPLLAAATHPILVETPPEVLAGSTRMGAGTAQKIVLNTLSTTMAVLLGHVHDGMMVNLRADNAKLRQRSVRIVGRIAGVDTAAAEAALARADGDVKTAVMLASGAATEPTARALLAQTGGHVRQALAQLRTTHTQKTPTGGPP